MIHQSEAGLGAAQVRLEDGRPTALGFHLLDGAMRPLGAPRVVDHHVGSLPGKFQGNLPPQAGPGASDQGPFPA